MLNDSLLKKMFFTVIVVILLTIIPMTRILVWGWIIFLVDVLPRIRPDWATILLAIIATFIFTAGIHWWGRTTVRIRQTKETESLEQTETIQSRWSFQSTICLVSLLFLFFISGISMVGLIHQAIWLSTSKEPRFQETLGEHGFGTRNELKQIGLALHNYHDIHRSFPIGGTFSKSGEGMKSWESSLQGLLGYTFSGEYDENLPWNHTKNQELFQCVLPIFINSELNDAPLTDSDGYGLSHYAANSHVMGGNKSLKISDISDGTSNTLLIGEVNANFMPWGHPFNYRDPAIGINKSPHGFGGPTHRKGAMFVMGDGRVVTISDDIDPAALRALSTPNGGEFFDEGVLEY